MSWPTAKRWPQRYLELGEAGLVARSSRPDRMPLKTPRPVVRKIVHLDTAELYLAKVGRKREDSTHTLYA